MTMTAHSTTKTAKTGLLLCMVALCAAAQAQCWDSPGLTKFAEQIAAQHFPALLSQMPTLVECAGEAFAPGVGGDYTGGIHRIRIPQWQRNRPDVKTTVAHELAHAAVAVGGGGDGSANGHSEAFYRELIRAGFGQEAHRVASQYGNLHALAQAGGQANPPQGHAPHGGHYGQGLSVASAPMVSPPVARWMTVCRDTPVVYSSYMPHHRAYQLTTVMQRSCQQELR